MKRWLALGIAPWLVAAVFGQTSDDKHQALPSIDYETAQTHELQPHRGTIPLKGVEPGFNQLHLTLTLSSSGDVVDARAEGEPAGLAHWPEVRDEVMQWKFTPFERNGHSVPVELEEYLDLVPPERLPSHHIAPPIIRKTSDISISLERSGCFGSCPSYSVRIHGNEAVFEGSGYVVASGRHTARIDTAAVRTLAARFIAADFYSMRPEYIAGVTDNPTYVVGISIDGHRAQVTDYVGQWVGMPAVIHDLEEAVDQLADTRRWIGGSEGLVSSLRVEKFNFATYGAQTILKQAAQNGQTDTVRELLQAGVSLRPLPKPPSTDPNENSFWQDPGWLESAATQPEALQVLIDAGASRKDQRDKNLALVRAVRAGKLESAEALIDYGADPNSDPGKLTVTEGAGGGMESQGPGQGNVLYYAAESGNLDVVREILRYHPDVNLSGYGGKTPLFAAGDYRSTDKDGARVEIVRILVAAGADVNARDKDGNTPLHETFLTDVEEELIQLGADVNARNNDGETPIFTTVDDAAIPLLIRHGADLTIRNNEGQTVLDAASAKGPLRQEALRKAIAAQHQRGSRRGE